MAAQDFGRDDDHLDEPDYVKIMEWLNIDFHKKYLLLFPLTCTHFDNMCWPSDGSQEQNEYLSAKYS